MNEPNDSDRLDQALDALATRGPRTARDGLESFPAEVRTLLTAATAAREALAAELSPRTRARHLVEIMEAAQAGAPRVVWGPERKPRRRWILRPALALGTVAALALAPAMALAANAAPGDRLYGTKLAVEKIRLILETGQAEDVRIHIELSGVRLSELAQLVAEGRTDEIGEVMSNLAWHNRAAGRGVADLKASGEEVAGLQASLAATLSHHIEILTGLSEGAECDPEDPEAGDPQCKGLLNAITNSSKVLDQVTPPGLNRETGSGGGEPPGRSGESRGSEVSEDQRSGPPVPPPSRRP